MASRLNAHYENEVKKALMEKFGYKSPMEIPKLEKIVINIGVGEAKDNSKALDAAVNDLALITGQAHVVTKARNSVANFKIREGMNIGCKVTLRKDKMYEFLDRLFNDRSSPCKRLQRYNPQTLSTGRGKLILSVLKSSSYSLKSITIKSTKSEVWTLLW